MFDEVRQRGIARVVDALLPGVVGFCAPVFDSDSRLVLGMVSLGPASTFDADWDGAPARALRQAGQALSADLGHQAA
jgi:DNA-binding IclR family transcriptional regulator